MKHAIILFFSFILFLSSKVWAQERLSLEGSWTVKLDPSDVGVREHWWNSAFTEKVILPGSLATNGLGDTISLGTKWTGDIFDSTYFFSEKYAKYRQKNIKIPFWLKPDKSYVGVAWYKKMVTIPDNWLQKKVILHLERCHWECSVFVNGNFCGTQNSLVSPQDFDISGYLKKTGNTITLRVDNSIKINIGFNSSSITDHTQTNWNGVIGNLFLQAKEQISIESVRVNSDIETSEVELLVGMDNRIRPQSGANIKLQVSLKDKPQEVLVEKQEIIHLDKGKSFVKLSFTLKQARLWDEFSPSLYVVKLILSDSLSSQRLDSQEVTFGFRKVSTKDKQIYLNNHPIFLRGEVDCAGFPLTGYPAMDRNYWNKIGTTLKQYGFNHLRFHSWCPPEVAFSMADSLGIYLYVEGPLWANFGSAVGTAGEVDAFIYQESENIIKSYGNHPSFMMMSYGNEPAGYNQEEFFTNYVAHLQKIDNRRLYTSGAGWPMIAQNDFHIHSDARIQHWQEGNNSVINAQQPNTTYDWNRTLSTISQPYISHEIGQWCAYPNFNEIAKYKGILKATNFEIFKETLQKNGMLEQANDFLYASGRLQTLCYKADIEAALRTPKLAGFQLLGLHDFSGQGTALVGALDAFWESKGYTTAEEYRTFCNSTVLLARIPKLIYKNDEKLSANLEIAHFGSTPLVNQQVHWTIEDEKGVLYREGTFEMNRINIGNNQPIGDISIDLSAIKVAKKMTLTTQLVQTTTKNSWNFWVYPTKINPENEIGKVHITTHLTPSILEELKAGKTVLLLTHGKIKEAKGGKIALGFSSIFWNTAWTNGQAPHTLGLVNRPKHPIFNYFPTDVFSDYQWHDIMMHSQVMDLESFSISLKSTIQPIDTWFENRRLSLAFEGKVGKGKLMVCSIDLMTNIASRPSTNQFKYSLLKYLNSRSFNPTEVIDPAIVQELLTKNN